MALLLPFVIVGGYFYPKLGFTVVGMITLFMILSSQRGRFYCGWLCPMGAFHERILTKVSLHRPIPPIYKTSWFRWFIFVIMMGFMLSRLWAAWGDPEAVGGVFRMMWIVSMSYCHRSGESILRRGSGALFARWVLCRELQAITPIC